MSIVRLDANGQLPYIKHEAQTFIPSGSWYSYMVSGS
jgi:hypothetical protein